MYQTYLTKKKKATGDKKEAYDRPQNNRGLGGQSGTHVLAIGGNQLDE